MGPAEPSPFFRAHLGALRDAAHLGPALDLACGRGRHALAAGRAGVRCIAMDRDREALAALARAGEGLPLLEVRADLETRWGIPVRPRSCGAILVFRFLFRPLAAAIEQALHPGGLLLYETFTTRQLELAHGPRNRDFLLEPGELPGLFPNLEVVDFYEGLRRDGGKQWHVASLAALAPPR